MPEAYLHAKFYLDPSNRLATIHQRYRQDRHTVQRSDIIGRTVLQTVAQKPPNAQGCKVKTVNLERCVATPRRLVATRRDGRRPVVDHRHDDVVIVIRVGRLDQTEDELASTVHRSDPTHHVLVLHRYTRPHTGESLIDTECRERRGDRVPLKDVTRICNVFGSTVQKIMIEN